MRLATLLLAVTTLVAAAPVPTQEEGPLGFNWLRISHAGGYVTPKGLWNGAQLHLNAGDSWSEQSFHPISLGLGGYHLRTESPEYCLDATTANPANGTPIKMWECYGDVAAQKWSFRNTNVKDVYQLSLAGSNKCLDVTNGDGGLSLQLWDCADGNSPNPNQSFAIKWLSDK